ncbi:MAG: co-chaperone GroES [Bacteroidales bacterium]|nr:co-chaperone GroES [Bacteroidales bacterium]
MTNIDKIIVIGDRVLVQPSDAAQRTASGLYLPAGYQDKEEVQGGYILKTGPGYAMPNSDAEDWTGKSQQPKYMPLQVREGDYALFLQKNAIEVKYNGEKYFIVPQNAILIVERDF